MSKFSKILLAASVVALVGCGKTVKRVASDSVIDLSGKWNDTDSRLVAEEMLNDCLNRAWYQNAVQAKSGAMPTIVVGQVRNKSHEHINVETFIKDMQRTLINSGKVEFVANSIEREELRNEIASQSGNATDETRKEAGQELGADLMLTGSLNSIVDQEDGEQVIFYQIDLELTDVQSHRKLWIGDKKIKKYIKKSGLKL